MFKQGGAADSFFGNWLYEQIMGDRPHLLRDLVRVVDFDFVNTECAPLYAEETGRPPYEPALMFKMVCLQFLYNLSDRQVEVYVVRSFWTQSVKNKVVSWLPWVDGKLPVFQRATASLVSLLSLCYDCVFAGWPSLVL